MNKSRLATATLLFIFLLACNLIETYVTLPGTTVKLVDDSDRIRRLLQSEASRDAAIASQWRQKSPDERRQIIGSSRLWLDKDALLSREQFMRSFSSNPGVEIKGDTHFHVVRWSDAACDLFPTASHHYLEFIVTSGPMKGRLGWGCDLEIKPKGDWVL